VYTPPRHVLLMPPAVCGWKVLLNIFSLDWTTHERKIFWES